MQNHVIFDKNHHHIAADRALKSVIIIPAKHANLRAW